MAQQTSTDEFAWDDPFGDQNGPAHEFLVSQTPFTSIFGDFTEEYNIDTNNISFDEIIDLLPTADECSKTVSSRRSHETEGKTASHEKIFSSDR